MIKAIMVDDEKHCAERLQYLLADYTDVIQIVATCHSVKEAKTSIEKLAPDLVFLDIQLNEKTAFDLLRAINRISFKIIFTTAHDEYAIEAIKFSAFDYLLKPIDSNELRETINRLNHTLGASESVKLDALFHNTSNTNEKKIIIATEKETYFLDVSDIVRCEADGSYTRVHLTGHKTILASKTLKYFDELLSSHKFFRVHQSHLINIKLISKYIKGTKAYILMNDKSEVPIAKRRKDDFLYAIGY